MIKASNYNYATYRNVPLLGVGFGMVSGEFRWDDAGDNVTS